MNQPRMLNFSRRPITDWVAAGLLGLALAILLVLGLELFHRWQASLAYPYQLDPTEGFILEQATALARGETIYPPIETPPFLVGNYPPLFIAAYAPLVGREASLWELTRGRWLTIGAALLAAALLAWIAARLTRRILPALLAAALFLVSYEVHHWSPFVRVDLPALALTLAGLGLFLTSRRRRWTLVVSGLFFVAAVYTRQTAVLAPLAAVIALALHDRRRLLWFAGPALAVSILALAALEIAHGGRFLRHIILYNANVMDWAGWRMVMRNQIWYFHHFMILALAVAAAARFLGWLERNEWRSVSAIGRIGRQPDLVLVRNERIPRHARHALGIYTILAVLSLVSYAKVGAAPNYVLEPLAAVALWLAISLGWLLDGGLTRRVLPATQLDATQPALPERTSWLPRPIWPRVAGVAVCLLLLAHAGWLWQIQGIVFSTPNPTSDDRIVAGQLASRLRSVEGELLSEEPFFTLLAGRQVWLDPFVLSLLAREGRWDETPFLKLIETRRFAALIVNEDLTVPRSSYARYTPAMADAIRRNYHPADAQALHGLRRVYTIWLPRP